MDKTVTVKPLCFNLQSNSPDNFKSPTVECGLQPLSRKMSGVLTKERTLMWNQFLKRLADTEADNSLSSKLRGERFALFKTLSSSVLLPLEILDVGGRQAHWVREGFCDPINRDNISITIINVESAKVSQPNVTFVSGDARNMEQFADNQFDIVFSNSVIEHVGTFDDQHRMASEIKRVSKRYFLQTPNRYFPIEPHFLFPFFQFFPTWLNSHLAPVSIR
ncbi:MAG: class I SAM-dependent methyltransferase [Phormidesmis sp. CAN_BIN44]|nr:class I SAM-dependent methyltransferase [Phormidesmis sp. CAN_BIN44]